MDETRNLPLVQDIILDLTESQLDVVYANQYDNSGRIVNLHIQDEGIDFDCSGYTVELFVKKSNGKGLSRTIGKVDEEGNIFGSVSGNIVSFPIDIAMTYSYGRQECSLAFASDTVTYSCKFYLRVNEGTVDNKTIIDSDDYQTIHDEYTEIKGLIETAKGEVYTDSTTTPSGQKDGDYWTKLLDDEGKAERYVKQGDEYKLLSYATSSESVEMTDGTDLQTKMDEIEESISTLDATPDNIVLYAEDEEVVELPTVSQGNSIEVDSELSETSENPVQNKVITAKLNEVFQSVSNGKSLIASAITDKGIHTDASDSFQTIANNINALTIGEIHEKIVFNGGAGLSSTDKITIEKVG